MNKGKLSRQDVFNKVWDWFIVQGKPYSIDTDEFLGQPSIYTPYRNRKGLKSPAGLLIPEAKYNSSTEDDSVSEVFSSTKTIFNNHVDFDFFDSLENAHSKTVGFIFNGVNLSRVRNFYARKFRRAFRKTMKYYLISTAMLYNLTIPSELPRTSHARKFARKYKD